MTPSSEVGEASGEKMGIGEIMEDVVTMVDAMTSAVEAVDAMMTAVEMREWLEVGRPEAERTTAVHFFSRALAVQKRKKSGCGDLPLFWPGLLPDLVQLLADCLLPHNSRPIQSGAMLSLKYLIVPHNLLDLDQRLELFWEMTSHAIEPLLGLIRETDCAEIRNQAVWLLGRMAWPWPPGDHSAWLKSFLPLLMDLVRKYAAILEPTEAEISSLNTAIKALMYVYKMLHFSPHHPQPSWEPDLQQILPVLIGIFKKPGNRKKAQIREGQFLETVAETMDGNFLLGNGVIGMLLEMVRVGKEPTAVLVKALRAIRAFIGHNNELKKDVVDTGALDVIHLVLKRPNDRFKNSKLWTFATDIIGSFTGEHVEAVLSQEGLVELVLDLALGMDLSEETEEYHSCTLDLLYRLVGQCSESQMRRLILKGPLRVLHRYLNWEHWDVEFQLKVQLVVRDCLARSSAAHQPTLRRLLDDTAITDDFRSISLAVPQTESQELKKWCACDILDTYFNNTLPPLPTNKLPSIIYTRNVPFPN